MLKPERIVPIFLEAPEGRMDGLMDLEKKGGGINFIPCLTWVRRGVAKWVQWMQQWARFINLITT
jgi:hypothetical protein